MSFDLFGSILLMAALYLVPWAYRKYTGGKGLSRSWHIGEAAPLRSIGSSKETGQYGIPVRGVQRTLDSRGNVVGNMSVKRMTHNQRNFTYCVDYTATLSPRFMTLGLADYGAREKFDIDETYGSPSTGDAAFDGNFLFTTPPHPKSLALLKNKELREHLTELSYRLENVWIHKAMLTFREPGDLTDFGLDATAELLSGIFMNLEFEDGE